MSILMPCLSIGGNLGCQLFYILTKQVRKHIHPSFPGYTKHLSSYPSTGDPDGQLRLNWSGERLHCNTLASSPLHRDAFTSPQLAYRLNILLHNLFALSMLVRGKDKIVGMPAGCKGNAHTSP